VLVYSRCIQADGERGLGFGVHGYNLGVRIQGLGSRV